MERTIFKAGYLGSDALKKKKNPWSPPTLVLSAGAEILGTDTFSTWTFREPQRENNLSTK